MMDISENRGTPNTDNINMAMHTYKYIVNNE